MELDNTTYLKLIALLKEKGIAFTEKQHAPTLTSEESAREIIYPFYNEDLRSAGVYVLCVMSAALKLDLKLVKGVLNTKSLSFASEQEVLSITKCLPGAVPPFGSLFGIKTYLDESLRREAEIEFNAGLRTNSVHMKESDYELVEKPQVVKICQVQGS